MASTASQYYVDSVSGVNSAGNGTGTGASAYLTIQYALDDIGTTHGADGTNGDKLNLKGTFNESSLSLTTYGRSPTGTAQLTFQGYGSTAEDGTRATIDGGTGSIMASTTEDFIGWVDLNLLNDGSSLILQGDNGWNFYNCKFYRDGTPTAALLECDTTCNLINCLFQDGAGHMVSTEASTIHGCMFIDRVDYTATPTSLLNHDANAGMRCSFCLFVINGSATATVGYTNQRANATVEHCSFWANGGTGKGLWGVAGGSNNQHIFGNLFEGFSGAGGIGYSRAGNVYGFIEGNAAYNCTSEYGSNTGEGFFTDRDNEVLSASPFVDAANGDFSPVDTGNVKYGTPLQFAGGHTNWLWKGAIQPEEPAGGGGMIVHPGMGGGTRG